MQMQFKLQRRGTDFILKAKHAISYPVPYFCLLVWIHRRAETSPCPAQQSSELPV